MGKPIIFYDVAVHTNRMTGGPVYVPVIVEREQAVPLEMVIRLAGRRKFQHCVRLERSRSRQPNENSM